MREQTERYNGKQKDRQRWVNRRKGIWGTKRQTDRDGQANGKTYG